ncbi:GNVR domain-containing protein [Gemmatimonadota bacterium]
MDRQYSGNETHPVRETSYSTDGSDISPIELINVVLRNRRLFVLIPLIIFIFVEGYTFIQPRTYSSSCSFVPQSSPNQSSLTTTLAAQFGVSVPAGDAGQTPEFYADLIISREILSDLIDTTYVYHDDNDEAMNASLSELLEIKGESEEIVREKTIQVLGKLLSVSTDLQTGLVNLSVQSKWPAVSQRIAQYILDLVNQFNLATRKTQATAERIFTESRLEEVAGELRESEDALQDFLQTNRQWEVSPELAFVHDRLTREVIMRQQIFTTLSQAYEQARIDEVRDTPVITIVEKPETPVMPGRRRMILKGILAIMVGGMLGLFIVFGREFMTRVQQQETAQFAEYKRLKQETFQDMKNPLRLLK